MFLFSYRAKKIIKQQIDELSIDRIPYRKAEIVNAIKWFYWQGTFSKKEFDFMNSLLSDKYTRIMHEWELKIKEDSERSFKSLIKMYSSDT